jgi:hypothetical protein
MKANLQKLDRIAQWMDNRFLIPGDIFDIGWKVNLRNAALIRDHLKARL